MVAWFSHPRRPDHRARDSSAANAQDGLRTGDFMQIIARFVPVWTCVQVRPSLQQSLLQRRC